MSGNEPPKGPDLGQWTEVSRLEGATPFAGQVSGEAVIACRAGNDVVAVGASCTHYGGPLGEGLIVGNTIRCPWHHACFDLRTGEAVRAPALNPEPVFDVEVGERIRVIGKRGGQPPRLSGQARAPVLHSLAIVGAGAAGNACADMLRRRGFGGPVTMFGTEDPVDRPNLSKEYLAGSAPEEWLPLPTPQDIEFVRKRVTKLDARTKTLTIDDGSSRAFDAILLAPGADPLRLPIPGRDQRHVHYLLTRADSQAIIDAAKKGGRAVVVGAGFIGLEVAASLRVRNVDVTVVAPEDIPLARIMGDAVGRFVQRLHESHGVRFFLGTNVKSIEPDAVVLANGERLTADFVIIGAGVRPNTQVAEAAGLKVENGIVVNEFLETSAPGVYAAGDVARFPDRFTGKSIRV